MKDTDKPDFDKMAKEFALTLTDENCYEGSPYQNCTFWGMKKIWNDYVLPLMDETQNLHKELSEADRHIIIKKQQIQERDAKIAELEEENEKDSATTHMNTTSIYQKLMVLNPKSTALKVNWIRRMS